MNLKDKNGNVIFTCAGSIDTTLVEAARRGVDFSQVVLDRVSFFSGDLKDINLKGITLKKCSFYNTTLEGINFTDATLTGTRFVGVIFTKVKFLRAKLGKTVFCESAMDLETLKTVRPSYIKTVPTLKGIEARTSFIPQEGSFLGYKKLRNGLIATLEIGQKAKRCHGASRKERKCRCSSAKVISIVDKNGKKVKQGTSDWDPSFKYVVGKTVKPRHPFDDNRWNTCASGIHFFPSFPEAAEYDL